MRLVLSPRACAVNRRVATRRAAAALVASFAAFACGGPQGPPPVVVKPVSERCPDVTKQDDVGAFDFATEYRISKEAADKLRAGTLAAMELGRLSEKLDAELGIACAQVAHDLGDDGDYRSGADACTAAIKVAKDARAKLGPKASVRLLVRAPACQVDASLMAKCASICDSSTASKNVKSECATMAGRCDGDCDGACEASAASACKGRCIGVCDGQIKGTCAGICKGTCDGKRGRGPCAGTCVGLCEKGPVEGECDGLCAGTCAADKPGICSGLCMGKCTVELADAKCAGGFKMPEVSTDCRARCDLAVINQTECSTPHVGLVIVGAADAKLADKLRVTVDKSFPGLVKELAELGPDGGQRVLGAQAVIKSALGGFGEIAKSGQPETAQIAERQIRKCFEASFKSAVTTGTAVKSAIDQATSVRDELTK